MSYFTKQNLQFLEHQYHRLDFINESSRMNKYASVPSNRFDIFLSHSFNDEKYIKGLYAFLTYSMRFNVYVDWIVDPELNRDDISAIIHLGACSSTTETNADYLLENNYRYTVGLANFAISAGIRFVYASSAATYGDGACGFSDAHDRLLTGSPA